MDIDPDDVFRDDEDPENEYQQRDATKEMLVYLVDASPKMFSTVCPSEEQKDVSHFEATLSCILSSLKTQIINRSYDEVAICFFNTREKKNLQDLNGVYVFNVPEREDLDRPTARLIKEFDCLQESFSKQIGSKYGILPGTRDNSLYNALWAAQALLRKGSAKTADKRILLFTNEDDPFGNIKGVTKMDMMRTTIQRAKDAQDLGISIELLPLSTPDDDFNVSTFYADLLGLEGNALAEFKALATERFEEMNDQLRKRMFRKRKVRRINFIIANGISIELNTYALVRPTNPGAVTWLDSVTNLPIKTERSFFCSDTGALLQEPPKYFQTYKSENIMFTADELSEIKRASTGHLRLLGFKPLSCLEDYHNLRPSTFVFPSDEEVVGSSCIFIALHRSMLQLKRFAVAFYGGSTHPQLVALVAQDEIMSPSGQVEPPGMHMIYLPYSDDIRHIEELHTDPTHLTPRATEDQIKSATSLVKRIDLKNFSVCQFANPGEIFEEEKVEEEEVEVEEEEVEVEVEKVEVEEEVEVEEVKEESVEKVHKWLFKEEEDMTWETYRYCSNWNTIERSILMKTIHNFAKANCPKDYWKVRTWMNLSDTYNEMAVRTNQIKRSYHEIIGGGKYLQSLFTIERQRHFHENTPVDQILLDIFEPCNECRNRIPVFPKSLLYNGSNPSTSFGSRTDSSSHSKKQWTPDELELIKSTISDFSSASMPKPYWDVQLWTDLSETYNVQARFKNLNTVSYLEFISGGMQLQSIFCEERLSNAWHGFGSRGRDFVLMKIFEPCLECRKRIPVFPNGLPNNGSTSSASSSARSVQSHFTSYEDESYSATLNNMLIVVREMFEKGLLTSAQLSIVTFKLQDFAQSETWKMCLLNNIFTLEMKREVLIQMCPEA